MAILKYIPIKKEVIDRRTTDGGYYIAVCENCGNEFYPKRSNAMYCSRSCLVMAYRAKKPSVRVKAPKVAAAVKEKTAVALQVFSNRDSCIKYLREKNWDDVKGKISEVRSSLKGLAVGKTYKLASVSVTRISANKYSVNSL